MGYLTDPLVVYMGLEVGGCSLFADPSGYVGRRTHQPWEDEGHVTGVTYHSLRRLTGCMLNWMIAVLAIGGLQPATETLLTITWQLA